MHRRKPCAPSGARGIPVPARPSERNVRIAAAVIVAVGIAAAGLALLAEELGLGAEAGRGDFGWKRISLLVAGGVTATVGVLFLARRWALSVARARPPAFMRTPAFILAVAGVAAALLGVVGNLMLVAWIAFPALLAALTIGCGLLVERAYGDRLPGPLLPSLGLALIIVVAYVATGIELGATLAPWVVLLLAGAGFALGWRRVRYAQVDGWAAALAIAVFAVFAAPVVLSGEPTFLGYFVNNDSAFWFGLADWVFDHGRATPAQVSSQFEIIAHQYLTDVSPLGSFMPFGVGRALVGADAAWLFAPYLSFVLALAALALYSLAHRVRPSALRALAAFVAITSGLIYAYFASQSAIKEVGMLWALIAAVAVVVVTLPRLPALRVLVPATLVFAAGFFILNVAALPWLGLAAATFGAVLLWRIRNVGWRSAAPHLAIVGVVLAVVALTSLGSIRQFVNVVSYLSDTEALGTLRSPLSKWQMLGIWPQSDFRDPLDDHARVGYALIGVAFAAFVLGALWAVRRRLLGPLLLMASAVLASLYLVPRGSPYADAKVYMIASAAVVFTAMLGAASLHESGRRVEGWALALVLAAGVVWTDALILQGAQPAPHDRYAEMTSVGERLAGHGPTLFTEADEFVAYFPRDAQPTGGFYGPRGSPLEVRPDAPSAEAHAQLSRIPAYDLDELSLEYVQSHPAIVRRRSPTASRPPANYERTWTGDYYEIWQRDPNRDMEVLAHIPLGGGRPLLFGGTLQPAERVRCGRVRSFAARAARRGARLAYVERPQLQALILPEASYDGGQWADLSPDTLRPIADDAELSGEFTVTDRGPYAAWIRGVFGRGFAISINGSEVGVIEDQFFAPPGHFARVGEAHLSDGAARITVRRQEGAFRPGQSGDEQIGPLVLQPEGDQERVRFASPGRAEELCGRRLDWVELVVP